MAPVTDEGFIVIDDQVAMPEDTLCTLLNVTPERIKNLVRFVGMRDTKGGVYRRGDKYYFASPEVVFKMYFNNGLSLSSSSPNLSQDQVCGLFAAAEKRLLSHSWLAIARQKTGLVILFAIGAVFFGLCGFMVLTSESKPATPPTKTEQTVKRPEETFYSTSYNAIEKVTGMLVTEKWMLDFSEQVIPNGRVETHGSVELNGDGIKRQFWLMFDEKSRRLLRIKVGPDLIYLDLE